MKFKILYPRLRGELIDIGIIKTKGSSPFWRYHNAYGWMVGFNLPHKFGLCLYYSVGGK